MAAFIGKWKGDMTTSTNYDNFCKASGIDGELVDKFRNSTFDLEFTRDGDNWTCAFNSSVWGSKTYEFKPGVEMTTTDPMGKGMKHTINFESDTIMRETQKSEMANWVPMTVVREVKDGKIHEKWQSKMSKADNYFGIRENGTLQC